MSAQSPVHFTAPHLISSPHLPSHTYVLPVMQPPPYSLVDLLHSPSSHLICVPPAGQLPPCILCTPPPPPQLTCVLPARQLPPCILTAEPLPGQCTPPCCAQTSGLGRCRQQRAEGGHTLCGLQKYTHRVYTHHETATLRHEQGTKSAVSTEAWLSLGESQATVTDGSLCMACTGNS
jgi:hypothetical protein